MINYTCPKCHTFLSSPSEFAGKIVGCPNCSLRLWVPKLGSLHQDQLKPSLKKPSPDLTPSSVLSPLENSNKIAKLENHGNQGQVSPIGDQWRYMKIDNTKTWEKYEKQNELNPLVEHFSWSDPVCLEHLRMLIEIGTVTSSTTICTPEGNWILAGILFREQIDSPQKELNQYQLKNKATSINAAKEYSPSEKPSSKTLPNLVSSVKNVKTFKNQDSKKETLPSDKPTPVSGKNQNPEVIYSYEKDVLNLGTSAAGTVLGWIFPTLGVALDVKDKLDTSFNVFQSWREILFGNSGYTFSQSPTLGKLLTLDRLVWTLITAFPAFGAIPWVCLGLNSSPQRGKWD